MARYILILGTLALSIFLVGCSSAPVGMKATKKVEVSQAGDFDLTCGQLETKVEGIESEVKASIEKSQKQANKKFAAKTIANLAIAFLSNGSTASNHLDEATLGAMNAEQKLHLQALADRHHLLVNIAKQKKCDFVPKVEARMQQLKNPADTMSPALDEQNYRKRMGEMN